MSENVKVLDNSIVKSTLVGSTPKFFINWIETKKVIESRLDSLKYKTWISGLELLSVLDKEITVSVPNHFYANFIEEHLEEIIRNAVYETSGKDFSIKYKVVKEIEKEISTKPKKSIISKHTVKENSQKQKNLKASHVLSDFSFDRLVKGFSNKEAFVAAQMIADSDIKLKANPLIIYGESGMGKTHLLHAIGNRILGFSPNKKVLYIPAIQLTYDLRDSAMSSGKSGGVANVFNTKYKDYDVLLIDDIQFIKSNTQTETLFVQIVETMKNRNAQIVITSDKKPSDIPNLNKRLLSRFQSGLLLEVGTPTHTMKVDILRKKAELNHMDINEDVYSLIADCPAENVRELEGYFIKVVAYSFFKREDVSLTLVKNILGKEIRDKYALIKISDIIKAVATEFNIDKKDIISANRHKEIMLPRQIAMFLAKLHTSDSLEHIGESFGKNHSTVLHSISRIKKMAFSNSSLSLRLKDIEKRLGKN